MIFDGEQISVTTSPPLQFAYLKLFVSVSLENFCTYNIKTIKMSLYGLPNPAINTNILFKMYKEMKVIEYEKVLKDTLARGTKFITTIDHEFSKSLSQEDAVFYAEAWKSFLNAFRELEKSSHLRNLSSVYLAKTTAWWQCVNAFRRLHGKPASI